MKAGFSLIEALIAMAIVSLALLAIYGLQTQLVRGEARSEKALATAQMQSNALTVLRDINPSQAPSGAMSMAGGRTLHWTSTPVTDARPATGADGTPSRFSVQLFTVQARVLDSGGQVLAVVKVDRVGWLQPPPSRAPRP